MRHAVIILLFYQKKKKNYLLLKQFLPISRVFMKIPRQLTHGCSSIFHNSFHFCFKASRKRGGHNIALMR